jgi:hypothetical protein
MLYKSLVSFIAAIAVTSGVAVSATPVARGGGTSECNTGSVACCDQVVSGNDPTALALGALLGIAIPVNVPVGLNCLSVVSAVQW